MISGLSIISSRHPRSNPGKVMARARYLPGQIVSFEVKRNRGKRTLTGYLASRLFIHDNRARAIISEGQVLIDGNKIDLETIVDLKAGSIINITFPAAWPPYMQPTAMNLDIIYEDDCMIAVNKPAGRVVHPSSGHLTGETLQNGILHHLQNTEYPDKMISPAHRLDRYTTGVIIYSKTQKAYKNLTASFRNNRAHKTYLVITDGTPQWQELTVDQPLAVRPDNRELRWVPPTEEQQGSKEAITHFKVIEKAADWSLLEAQPVTGRSHQIRAHLKYLNLPVMCDHEYNPEGRKLHSISFQALHARELQIPHPENSTELLLTAELPSGFSAALKELRETKK